MYHPFVEGLALTLVDLSITLVMQIVFVLILYFLVGLRQMADRFL